MNWFKAVLRTFGPRVIGVVAGAATATIYAKSRGVVQIDAQAVTELGTALLLGYSAGHRGSSSFINPGDAAKGRLATAEKDASTGGGTVHVDRDH